MLLGVISDTHGLLRPEAIAALRGSSDENHRPLAVESKAFAENGIPETSEGSIVLQKLRQLRNFLPEELFIDHADSYLSPFEFALPTPRLG